MSHHTQLINLLKHIFTVFVFMRYTVSEGEELLICLPAHSLRLLVAIYLDLPALNEMAAHIFLYSPPLPLFSVREVHAFVVDKNILDSTHLLQRARQNLNIQGLIEITAVHLQYSLILFEIFVKYMKKRNHIEVCDLRKTASVLVLEHITDWYALLIQTRIILALAKHLGVLTFSRIARNLIAIEVIIIQIVFQGIRFHDVLPFVDERLTDLIELALG